MITSMTDVPCPNRQTTACVAAVCETLIYLGFPFSIVHYRTLSAPTTVPSSVLYYTSSTTRPLLHVLYYTSSTTRPLLHVTHSAPTTVPSSVLYYTSSTTRPLLHVLYYTSSATRPLLHVTHSAPTTLRFAVLSVLMAQYFNTYQCPMQFGPNVHN
jgi:hypothetical protein